MGRWIKRTLVVAVFLALAALIGLAFVPQVETVETAAVAAGPLQVTINEEGQTRLKDRFVVSAPLAGRLLRTPLRPGDLVKADETVVAIIVAQDPSLLDDRARAEFEARVQAANSYVSQAESRQAAARAALDQAQDEHQRTAELVEERVRTPEQLAITQMNVQLRAAELDSATHGRQVAHFELQVAEAALLRVQPSFQINEKNVQMVMKSPINGRVLKVYEESEGVVASGAPLIELGDPARLEIVVDVLTTDAVSISQNARVIIEEWGGEKPLEGRVRLIEPSAFTKISALGVEEQRVNVIADFVSSGDDLAALKDGYRVEARIVIWDQPDVLKIPQSALLRRKEGWAVFVVRDERAILTEFEAGRRNGEEAQVVAGLTPGERVIVHPSDRITHGGKVAVKVE